MVSIALLGDSIFDNKSYAGGGEPDVLGHISNIAPVDWRAKLYAVDGSLVENVGQQLLQVENGTTHLMISSGGNNALGNADVLQMTSTSSAEVLNVLSSRAAIFEASYAAMLSSVLERNLPVAVSTIYYPNFPEPALQSIAVAALAIFNDVITRRATRLGLPILDLRLVCDEPADYANEIEPSGKGGMKIAHAIVKIVATHDFSKRATQVYF